MGIVNLWKQVYWCLLTTVHLNAVLCLVTYYMGEHCPRGVLNMVDHRLPAGQLRLMLKDERYRKDMLCLLTIRAPEDRRLMVRFVEMQIEGFMSEGCRSDSLILFDGPDDNSPSMDSHKHVIQYTKTPDDNRMCGRLTPRATFVSTGRAITFQFSSDTSIQKPGFALIFTAFHTGVCSEEEFMCKNKRCINGSLYCNEYNNCGDDSDWCGPNQPIVIFVIVLCVTIFVLLLSSVIRCTCKESVRRFSKRKKMNTASDLMTPASGMRTFRGFSRRESNKSNEASPEPQQEPLLTESQSSV